MKLQFALFSLLLAHSALGNQMSKEIRVDNPQELARHAEHFEDRLDGYSRWLYQSETEIEELLILSEMSKLGNNKSQREAVLVTLCERYLDDSLPRNPSELQRVLSSLLPQYINENIDPNYKIVAEQKSALGIKALYRNVVKLLLPSNPVIASAFFKHGYMALISLHHPIEAINFANEIYNSNNTNAEIAAIFVEIRAWELIKQCKYDQLMQACDTCSTLERMEGSPGYNYVRSITHVHKKECSKALTYARTALSLNSSSMFKKWLATVLTFNGQYDEAISHYYTVLKAGDFNDGLLEFELVQALQLAGRDTEATDLLLDEFKRIRKNLGLPNEPEKEIFINEKEEISREVSPIAKGQVKGKQVKEQTARQIKIKAEPSSSQYIPSYESTTSGSSSVQNLKKEFRDKEKISSFKEKRKGTPKPHFEDKEKKKEDLPSAETIKITVENLLGENSHHYTTFCNFFNYLDDETRLSSVHITMKEAQQLLKFFGEVDRSKGKGSHTKATLSVQAKTSEVEESSELMIILSKKSELLPYQIIQIRNAFLELGFYPKHLKATLIKKMLWKESR